MITTKETDQIDEALLMLSGAIGNLTRDTKNDFFKSKYVTLATWLDTIREPLQATKCILTASPSYCEGVVTVSLRIIHQPSGQWYETNPASPAKPDKSGVIGPQSVGSTITYLRRYGLVSLLNLAETDNDGNIGLAMDERASWVGPLSEDELTKKLRALWRDIEKAKDAKALEEVLFKHQDIITQCRADMKDRWDGTAGVMGISQILKRKEAGLEITTSNSIQETLDEIENRLSGAAPEELEDIFGEYDSHPDLELDEARARANDIYEEAKQLEPPQGFDGSSDQ